jgi:hypothetical protein
MMWWILLGLVVLVVLFVLRGRTSTRTQRLPSRPASTAAPERSAAGAARRGKGSPEGVDSYRGVMLFPQKDSCEAVLKFRGQTFPTASAPTVPVPGCGRESCSCQLHQVVGRRRGPRRLIPDRRADVRFKEDRRKGNDRRSGADTWKYNP